MVTDTERDLSRENEQLRKENSILKQERDILKKDESFVRHWFKHNARMPSSRVKSEALCLH